jgi:hypothetical protein
MSMIAAPDRFTTLPDEPMIASARIHIVLIRQVVGF